VQVEVDPPEELGVVRSLNRLQTLATQAGFNVLVNQRGKFGRIRPASPRLATGGRGNYKDQEGTL
jgi:hypothetical protein